MGTGEENAASKASKPASSSTQEAPMTPYPDWTSSMQAYYGAGATPTPFFASPVASPSPHPYMWGGQHPMIPPYGTPVPYPAMYPPGGMYAHPSMATAPSPTVTHPEAESKRTNGKDRASAKKSKGSSGGKSAEGAKTTSVSGNDGVSQSGDSGSEGSSDGTDENADQQEPASNKKGSFEQMLADASAQSNPPGVSQGKTVISMPATNLNMGMDLWNTTSTAAGAAKMRQNPSGSMSAIVPAAMPEQWIRDERELKRQKRKQSNRESARRSRLRKQAECEELQQRVENLTGENRSLREELQRLSEECEKLTSENNSIKEELTRICGPGTIANLERNTKSDPVSRNGEGDS